MSLSHRLTRLFRRAQLRLGNQDWLTVRRAGYRWRLNRTHHIDRELLLSGCFEPTTTHRLRQVIQPGMNVVDVGANIGYFSVLLADWVGEQGHVWAFEPTRIYGERLLEHLRMNKLDHRVTLVPLALSDHGAEAEISIGQASATLHPIEASHVLTRETIRLCRLDDLVEDLGIERIDLIKVDIDGHEPAFLRGAARTIARHRPILIVEFFQGNLDIAGGDVRQLKAQLEDMGYQLHSDRSGLAYTSRFDFLRECGNFSHSVNVWAYPRNPSGRRVESVRQAA